jgi:hypothetical protein
MEYLKIISKTFEQHVIFKVSELKYEKFTKSVNHPSSEGIKFETNNFAGEIFYYSIEEMEYLEIEFLVFNGEKFEFKIVEKIKISELNKIISEFLTERLTEIKNVA